MEGRRGTNVCPCRHRPSHRHCCCGMLPHEAEKYIQTRMLITQIFVCVKQVVVPEPTIMTDRVFIDECLRSINDYRRTHQVAPLTHNSTVSTIAQRWADQMARTGSLAHNPSASYNGQQLGENCAYKWFSDRRNITGLRDRLKERSQLK